MTKILFECDGCGVEVLTETYPECHFCERCNTEENRKDVTCILCYFIMPKGKLKRHIMFEHSLKEWIRFLTNFSIDWSKDKK